MARRQRHDALPPNKAVDLHVNKASESYRILREAMRAVERGETVSLAGMSREEMIAFFRGDRDGLAKC